MTRDVTALSINYTLALLDQMPITWVLVVEHLSRIWAGGGQRVI